jgi:hypothetical protein
MDVACCCRDGEFAELSNVLFDKSSFLLSAVISHGPNALKREYGTVGIEKWEEKGWDLLARSGILRCVFGGFGRFVGGNPRRGKWLGDQS